MNEQILQLDGEIRARASSAWGSYTLYFADISGITNKKKQVGFF
jgi:hypothetical protein